MIQFPSPSPISASSQRLSSLQRLRPLKGLFDAVASASKTPPLSKGELFPKAKWLSLPSLSLKLTALSLVVLLFLTSLYFLLKSKAKQSAQQESIVKGVIQLEQMLLQLSQRLNHLERSVHTLMEIESLGRSALSARELRRDWGQSPLGGSSTAQTAQTSPFSMIGMSSNSIIEAIETRGFFPSSPYETIEKSST